MYIYVVDGVMNTEKLSLHHFITFTSPSSSVVTSCVHDRLVLLALRCVNSSPLLVVRCTHCCANCEMNCDRNSLTNETLLCCKHIESVIVAINLRDFHASQLIG